ncbi:methyltransferase domain-containing protein [soil metagenome]
MAATSPNPAETYESYMVPGLFAPCAARLIEAVAPPSWDRVLDVACGTGIVARHAASHTDSGGTVTGLDISPDMLEVARSRAAEQRLTIAWHEGRAEALPFPDGAFDLVTCQFGLMFFTDRQAALAEMHRILTPDGWLVLNVFQGIDRHPFYGRLDKVIRDRFGISGVGDIFALGDIGQLQALVMDAGFGKVDIQPFDIDARFPAPGAFLAGEIAVDTAAIPEMQHLDATARAEMVNAIAGDMQDAMREVTDGDHIVMPFHVLILRAAS